MSNTIHINAATRILQRIQSNFRTGAAAEGGFSDALGAAKARDLDAYKASFQERLGLISFDATHASDDIAVTITEDGYRAMQADPEYEAWVLQTIQGAVSHPDAFSSVSGGSMIQMRFGATRAEYRGDVWRRDPDGMGRILGDEEKSYWEEREERAEENREISEKMADARARVRRANEIRKIQGRELLSDTTGLTSEIMALLLADFLG